MENQESKEKVFSDYQAETAKPNFMSDYDQRRFEIWVVEQYDPTEPSNNAISWYE